LIGLSNVIDVTLQMQGRRQQLRVERPFLNREPMSIFPGPQLAVPTLLWASICRRADDPAHP
jgi:hypothetical protein